MNIILYKKHTRFSIVKTISKNSVLNLFNMYKNIENFRFLFNVKTKHDFVSFTSTYVSCYKKTNFNTNLLTSLQIFKKNSVQYITQNTFSFFNSKKSHIFFSNVSQKKKTRYLNNNFFFFKNSVDVFFQGNPNLSFLKRKYFNIIFSYSSFNKNLNTVEQNFFNNFSIRLKFHYIYTRYALKKNTTERLHIYQIPFFYKNVSNNSFFMNKKVLHIQNKKNPKNRNKISNRYIPRKKRKRIVKRKRWKRKTNYSFFYKKLKTLFSKNSYKKNTAKYKPAANKSLYTKFSSLYTANHIKKTQIQNYKHKFNLSRILHYYIFKKTFLEFKKKKISSKTYAGKKNKYFFYSFPSFKKNMKKQKQKRKSRMSKKKDFLISVFKKEEKKYYRMNPTKREKKGYTHNKAFLQLVDNTSKILNQVPSMKYLNIKNFIQRTFGAKTSLFRINSYSFTRYSFNNAIKEKKFELDKKLKKIKVPKDRTWEGYRELLIEKKAKEKLWLKIANQSFKKTKTNALKNIPTNIIKKSFSKKKNWKKKKNSSLFRQFLEKERRRRYRYIAIYIKDLLRLSFVGFYYKHAQLRREFSAFILKKLPRNRKETKFMRFLIKIRKVFAAQREEVIGIRLRFQGRMNRWRRTKHIVGKKGILPLRSFDTTIAYGIAQGINRKGAFGRRLWISYHSSFGNGYQTNFYSYRNSKKL